MPADDDSREKAGGHVGSFATTQWSVVLLARNGQSPQAREALEQLCRTYWYALYAYIRRRGHPHEDAQDLTQGFFARLLEKNWLADIEQQGGRFRSFLLTALNRFLAGEYDRAQAVKRGGGRKIFSLDQLPVQERYLHEPATEETPEKAFERHWALTVLDEALTRLRHETMAAGRAQQFELLNPFLSREEGQGGYFTIAALLGMSPGAVGVAVHRLRRRYRELVREGIANTLTAPTQVEDEVRYLFTVLRG